MPEDSLQRHRLQPITPLGGYEPRSDIFPGLTIVENPDVALASLACREGRRDAFADAARGALGFDLPGAGQWTSAGDLAAFWTGPDQWFVEAPYTTHEGLVATLSASFDGAASVTEQSDAWVRFDLEGPAAPEVFERLCALDIRTMRTGGVSRTSIEHLGVFVVCREASRRFSVLGPRSSARSLHHALITAARSAL